MKATILSTFALCTFTFLASAQNDVIIINKSDLKSKLKKERRQIDNTQVIKFAPLNMLTGELNFGYERVIGNNMSLDFELGPTISEIGFGVDYHYSIYGYSDRASALGLVSSVGFRYYPSDDYSTLNGFYVSPKMRYKLMNHFVEPYTESNLERKMGSTNSLGFYFDFGYQFWLSSTFSLDIYSGFGIGFQTERSYYLNSYYDATGTVYEWEGYNYADATYLFNIGVKVGIGSK